MSKILVTAFEPFGLSGKMRGKNASKDVLDIALLNSPADCDVLVLPVNDGAERILREHLERTSPRAILSMGEALNMLPSAVKPEPVAYDVPVSVFPYVGRLLANHVVPSSYVKANHPSAEPTIGQYYCNRAYLTALQWAEKNGHPPTMFAHIAVLGDRNAQADVVRQLITNLDKTAPERSVQKIMGRSTKSAPAQ